MFPEPRIVPANGIEMAVYEQGSGQPVVFLHGFPELAFSWRHQLPAFAAAGWRAIAPDLRGYGRTTVPANVADYAARELIADVCGMLDALNLEKAVFVGHDWGALLLWQLALLHPERVARLVALNIPHLRRPPVDPIAIMRARFGNRFYIVDFQDSDEADRLFASDPRRFIDHMMRRNQVTRDIFQSLPPEQQVISLVDTMRRDQPSGDALLTGEELDYYAVAFARTGFTGAINWYRNWTRNWESLAAVDEIIRIPTLFIGAVHDVVVALQHIDGMKSLFTDLTIHMLDCGHWTQQERPAETSELILRWLD